MRTSNRIFILCSLCLHFFFNFSKAQTEQASPPTKTEASSNQSNDNNKSENTSTGNSSSDETKTTTVTPPVVVNQNVNTPATEKKQEPSGSITKGAKKTGWEPFYEIEVDLAMGTLSPNYLPFDAPFILKGKVPENVETVEVRYVPEHIFFSIDNCHDCYWKPTCFEFPDSVLFSKSVRKHYKKEIEAKIEKEKTSPCKERKNGYCDPVFLVKLAEECDCGSSWKKPKLSKPDSNGKVEFRLNILPLENNKKYRFYFRLTTTEDAKLVQSLLNTYKKELTNHIIDTTSQKSKLNYPNDFNKTKEAYNLLNGNFYKDGNNLIDDSKEIFNPDCLDGNDFKKLSNLYQKADSMYALIERGSPVVNIERNINDILNDPHYGNLKYIIKYQRDSFENFKSSLEELSLLYKMQFNIYPAYHTGNVIKGKSHFENYQEVQQDLRNNNNQLLIDTAIVQKYIANLSSFIKFINGRIKFLDAIYEKGEHPKIFEQFYFYDDSLVHTWIDFQEMLAKRNLSNKLILNYIELEKCRQDTQLNCIDLLRKESKFKDLENVRAKIQVNLSHAWDSLKIINSILNDKLLAYDVRRDDINTWFSDLAKKFDVLRLSLEDRLKQLKNYQKAVILYKKELDKISEKSTKDLNWRIVRPNELINGSIPNLTGLTSHNYATRINWYVSGDVGISYIPFGTDFSPEMSLYVASSFNLFPINREIRYGLIASSKRYGFWNSIRKNTSILLGVTLNNDDLTNTNRKPLWKSFGSPMLGVGLRISDGIRLSSGVVMFQRKDEEPLVEDYDLKSYWYWSLSFDIDVGGALGYLGKKLFPNVFQ